MIIEGTLFKGKIMLHQELIHYEEDDDSTHSARLESCLRTFCQKVGAPLPLWLGKNSREYVHFRQTIFFEDQFLEKVPFDKMQIRLIDEMP